MAALGWPLALLAVGLLGLLGLALRQRPRLRPRGPPGLPLIGSLHRLRGPGGPFAALSRLALVYGDVYEIRLGAAPCVVVSGYDSIREVLVTKGSHFGGRPDFLRFHRLFGGDRNNSLALCDWSDLQCKRRSIARGFCSPRVGSPREDELSRVAVQEVQRLLADLDRDESRPVLRGERPLKPLLLAAVANMFTGYMCSTRFDYRDRDFCGVVRRFDEIFWDINQGYAVDFLPWLAPLYWRHLRRLDAWATEIRSFILRRIVDEHRRTMDRAGGVPRDFTDALLLHLESPESELSWEHAIFELEDFLGGHSAIGNLVTLILANAALRPEVQRRVREECDVVLARSGRTAGSLVTLEDRRDMPYTEAVVWETLRVSSSPIVPHVATRDSDIGGFHVPKDAMIIVNNYPLNLAEEYWGPDSKAFRPERFLRRVDGSAEPRFRLHRPGHFMPFSTGKRTCIGQRLVQGFAFVLVAALFHRFDVFAVRPADVEAMLLPGCVAVPPDPCRLVLAPRARPGP